jgi:hypothetical protein
VPYKGRSQPSGFWSNKRLGRPPRRDSRPVEITQAALAAHVGATGESVNKWSGYYERRGYISRKRDSFAVLRLDELRSLPGME